MRALAIRRYRAPMEIMDCRGSPVPGALDFLYELISLLSNYLIAWWPAHGPSRRRFQGTRRSDPPGDPAAVASRTQVIRRNRRALHIRVAHRVAPPRRAPGRRARDRGARWLDHPLRVEHDRVPGCRGTSSHLDRAWRPEWKAQPIGGFHRFSSWRP